MFKVILLYTVFRLHSVWGEERSTCENTGNLIHLKDCNTTVSSQGYLQASCSTYGVLKKYSPFLGNLPKQVVIKWVLQSSTHVNRVNDTCLQLRNMTIELHSTKQDNLFRGLEMDVTSVLKNADLKIEEATIEIVFNKPKNLALFEINGDCGSFPQKFNTEMLSCNISILGDSETFLLTKWFTTADGDSIRDICEDVINDSRKSFYRNINITIPLLMVKFENSIINPKYFLSCFKYFNVLKIKFLQNNFGVIYRDSFPHFPELRELNLSKGAIERIDSKAFHNFTALETIDLSGNKLHTIPECFQRRSVPNLNYLNMERNRPRDGHFTLFFSKEEPSRVSILRLSKISISKLNRESFAAFPNLTMLYLDQCNITSIPMDTFHNLAFLASLDLSNNQIVNLLPDVFSSVKSLTNLNLSGNRFESIPTDSVELLWNLTVLNLQNNFIKTLALYSHPNIQVLNLRNNHIVEWSAKDSVNVSILQNLDLSSNHISVINEEMKTDLQKVNTLNISNNPFDCTPCNLYNLHLWLNSTDTESPNLYICWNPATLRGVPVLQLDSKHEDCLKIVVDIVLPIALSTFCVFCFIGILSILGYVYRWYIRYFIFRARRRIFKNNSEESSRHKKYDAFICYSDAQLSLVKNKLVPNVERKHDPKFILCVHDRDFEVGAPITLNIIESIDQSRKVVILLSNDFIQRKWCKFEMHLAQHRFREDQRDDLIFVVVEELNSRYIKRHERYLLDTRPCFELPRGKEIDPLFWERLANFIRGENADN